MLRSRRDRRARGHPRRVPNLPSLDPRGPPVQRPVKVEGHALLPDRIQRPAHGGGSEPIRAVGIPAIRRPRPAVHQDIDVTEAPLLPVAPHEVCSSSDIHLQAALDPRLVASWRLRNGRPARFPHKAREDGARDLVCGPLGVVRPQGQLVLLALRLHGVDGQVSVLHLAQELRRLVAVQVVPEFYEQVRAALHALKGLVNAEEVLLPRLGL
mmetsp:Transcript_32872/g.89060  ORF Transcript_32872/g.89060 Transcript_32872/m.89060 type:complete len:211 (+) Transcript_32872:444-1076(+)